MQNAKINVVRFSNEDVIATSAATSFSFSGMYDGQPNNGVITFSNNNVFGFNGNADDLVNAISTNMNIPGITSGTYIATGEKNSSVVTLGDLSAHESSDPAGVKFEPDLINRDPYVWYDDIGAFISKTFLINNGLLQ